MNVVKKNVTSNWYIGFIIVVLTYSVSHGLMFFLPGVWWDDNTVWNVTDEALYNYLGPDCFNNPFLLYYTRFLSNNFDLYDQLFVARIYSFVIYFITILATWFIIKKITNNYTTTLYVTLLSAASCINNTIMLIICTTYITSAALFLVGLLLFICDYQKPSYLKKIGISTLWLLSLCIWKSCALLIPLTVLFASYKKIEFNFGSKDGFFQLIKTILRDYWVIIVTCLIFCCLYVLYLSPQGEYKAYYHVGIKNILFLPLTLVSSTFSGFVEYLGLCIKSLVWGYNVIALIISIFIVLFYWLIIKYNLLKRSFSKDLIIYSCLYLVCSLVLSLLIGGAMKIYNVEDYSSRSYSLAVLPMSILIVYAISFIKPRFQNMVFSLLLAGSVIYSITVYIEYSHYLVKTDYIKDYFIQHQELDGAEILIKDAAFASNGVKDKVNNYAYEGIARIAYGKNTNTKINSAYGGNQYFIDNPQYIMYIVENWNYSTPFEHLYILFNKTFNRSKYLDIRNAKFEILLTKNQ